MSRDNTLCPGVSGSVTSFRMSHEIVPVHPAGMSHHIVPVGTSAAGIAPRRRKTMSRDIVPHLVRIGPGHQRNARRKAMAPACASLRPRSSPETGLRRNTPPRKQPQSARVNQRSAESHRNLAPTTTPNPTNHPTPGHFKNEKSRDTVGTMSRDNTFVPGGGLEPPRSCEHWHLKPARLPIPPPGRAT